MGLLDLIREDDSLYYISLEDAINILAKKTESNVWQVATYLLNKDIHIQLNSHQRGANYRVIETSTGSNNMDVGWVGENDAFFWLQYIVENETELYSPKIMGNFSKYYQGCVKTFWDRKQFFENKDIQFALSSKEQYPLPNKDNIELHPNFAFIWDANYLELHKNDAPNLVEVDSDFYMNESINFEDDLIDKEEKQYPLFFKNKTFSINEATCVMSGYKPSDTIWISDNVNWLADNPKYAEASDFIFSAVRTELFQEFSNGEYFITSDNLKKLLNESSHFIKGFNDKKITNITNEDLTENTQLKNTIASLQSDIDIERLTIKELSVEVEKLKAELLEKDQKIKALESIQTSKIESKLGNTRAENGVTKLLLVLAEMANININKPHSVHQSLLVQSDLLGIDQFPSDETIKKWLIKANKWRQLKP